MIVNKKKLINDIAKKKGLKKSQAKDIFEEVFGMISDELVNGNSVRIVGFGEFEVRKRVAREGRNPQTGAKIAISATKTPSFLAGKTLKDAVKSK